MGVEATEYAPDYKKVEHTPAVPDREIGRQRIYQTLINRGTHVSDQSMYDFQTAACLASNRERRFVVVELPNRSRLGEGDHLVSLRVNTVSGETRVPSLHEADGFYKKLDRIRGARFKVLEKSIVKGEKI